MKLSVFILTGLLTLGWALNFPRPSCAYFGRQMLRYSPVQQTVQSEVVVVGKVTALEPDLLKISQQPGGKKVNYMVAVVKVDQVLLGVKGSSTHLRVGFVPSANTDEDYDEDLGFQLGCRLGGAPVFNPNLHEGQEACFFLKKHHQADFYTLSQQGTPLHKSLRSFEDELDQVKMALQVLQDPLGALRAKEATDRQFAACVLVQKYRGQPQNTVTSTIKTEPIKEEESKLILTALGEMFWGDVGVDRQNRLSVQTIFPELALTEKDGWRPPTIKNGEDYNLVMGDAVKKWLKENASKHRIQRRVIVHKPITE